MDMRIPPLKIKILLESNPLKSRILVRRSPGISIISITSNINIYTNSMTYIITGIITH